ncbi:MAG: hypothetical protein ABR585_12810 [Gemmatimonadaceae bacterium]|nr:hypothetical protein [Actinomycetota bacterium]
MAEVGDKVLILKTEYDDPDHLIEPFEGQTGVITDIKTFNGNNVPWDYDIKLDHLPDNEGNSWIFYEGEFEVITDDQGTVAS